MFDFGFFELLLLCLIGLIVVGPERLPTLVRTVGLWVGRARAMVTSVRTEFEREVNASGVRETERRMREEITSAREDIERAAETSDGSDRVAGAGSAGGEDSSGDDDHAGSSTSEATKASAPGQSDDSGEPR